VSRFYELAREKSCVSATIVTSPFDRPEKAAWYCENLDYDAVDERLCQVTSLCFDADHSERLMTSFHQKTRNMVRKAEKVGVTVQVENEMLKFVSEVHSENMLAIGGIAKSKKFFSLVPKYFKANEGYRIYVARIAGEPVAAVLLFYFNRTVEYFTPVVRAGFRDTQALSGAIFRAMCDASRAGYHRWNWGGTWATQEGVYLFKRRWGAMDFPYRYFVKIYDRSLLRRRRDEILAEYPNFYVVPFGLLEQ
jgi:lipid II:glycine glycyltransferase (peptidoglycan interpeptide bridge formation enzyme)